MDFSEAGPGLVLCVQLTIWDRHLKQHNGGGDYRTDIEYLGNPLSKEEMFLSISLYQEYDWYDCF